MTNEQHFADDGDIKQLSLDETRSAAKQLLDSVEGDLTGDVAQRFQALTRHAEELRAAQRLLGFAAAAALLRPQFLGVARQRLKTLRRLTGQVAGDTVEELLRRVTGFR